MLNKVPEAMLVFWIAKIMATNVGETGGDFLAVELDFGLGGTSVVMIALPLVARSPWSAPGAASLVSNWVMVVLVGVPITDDLSDRIVSAITCPPRIS
jgi:uncharacterized membrane-anchored protein